MNYSRPLPRDNGGAPMQEFAVPYVALAPVQAATNCATSSVVYLHPNTTQIEVGVFGGAGAVIKWIPTTDTASASVIASGLGANFDNYVPPNYYRRFVVPKETGGQIAGQAGSVNGLYQRVARINAGSGASSVLITQF